MRLAGRVNRLEKKHGVHEHQHTRSAQMAVDSRYPEDQLNQFIAEHGFDDPDCILVVHSIVSPNDANPIIEPYVIRETDLSMRTPAQ